MSIGNLTEVGACLEETADCLPDDATPLERYLFWEELAIAVLDGQQRDFPDGVLDAYLEGFLLAKRRSLGISDDELP